MKLLGKIEGIDKPVLAGSTFTGNHRTYFGTCTACLQSRLLEESEHRFQIVVGNALDLQCQTGCHRHFAGAEFLRRLRDFTLFLRSQLPVSGDHADIKHIVISLILQTSQAFHSFDLSRRKFLSVAGRFHIVEEHAALQNHSIGVSVCFQAVLKEISSLSLGAYQKQFRVFIQSLNRAVHCGEVYPLRIGDSLLGLHVDHGVAFCRARGIFCGAYGCKNSVEVVTKGWIAVEKGGAYAKSRVSKSSSFMPCEIPTTAISVILSTAPAPRT